MKSKLFAASVAIVTFNLPSTAQARSHDHFEVVETTIADIQHAFRTGDLTPEQLVQIYLDRIAKFDRGAGQPIANGARQPLNSFMHVNEHALDVARSLKLDDFDGEDSEDEDGSRMPLFGIPVILKDNIATKDMPTTAGSIALGESRPPKDAFIADKLRRAGAVILGKGTLTEFANFISITAMPTGYSSQLRWQVFQNGGDLGLVGFGFNPFDPRLDPRSGSPFNDGRPALATGGSSSGPGIAVSANLATVGVGTETSGSILSPATQNLLVGIKPTVGLVSRNGIVPITADQDTAGPLARTVTDAAKLLGVLAGFDAKDPATAACLLPGNCHRNYTRFLKRHALRGARIAVPHLGYWSNFLTSDQAFHPSLSDEQIRVMNDAIRILRQEGAIVTDPFDIPGQIEISKIGTCVTIPAPASCSTVLIFGFKRDLNAYLAPPELGGFGPGASINGCTATPPPRVRTLTDVGNFNNACKVGNVLVGVKYDQGIVLNADKLDTTPGSADFLRYKADRDRDLATAKGGLDAVFKDFDAVLFPANRGAATGARAGYPSIAVPAGFVDNPAAAPPPFNPTPFPAGFNTTALPAPYAVTFTGPAFSEGKLIGYAYAFEQATHHRVPPDGF
jgi:amidase